MHTAGFLETITENNQPTSSMALTQVREPPHVAKSHTEAHTGEQVLGFVVPFGPVPCLLLLHPLQFCMRRDSVIQSRVWKLQLHCVFFSNSLDSENPLCLPLVSSCWFCYFPTSLRGAASFLVYSPLWKLLLILVELSLSLIPSPLLYPGKDHWGITCDLWHLNRSYQ